MKCPCCRAELTNSNGDLINANGSVKRTSFSTERRCQKCTKNEAKYGKPKVCLYCQLPAAFLGGKCVHCSHSERKYGPPKVCSNCKVQAAFQKNSNHRNTDKLLCRLCQMTYKQSLAKAESRKMRKKESGVNENEETSKKFKSSLQFAESGSNDNIVGEHILVVQQLKDEISGLKINLLQKDALIMQRDKKIAELNAELMRQERDFRGKMCESQKGHQDAQQTLQERIRDLSRQVSLLNRGKKFKCPSVTSNGQASPSLLSAS